MKGGASELLDAAWLFGRLAGRGERYREIERAAGKVLGRVG